LNLLKYSLFFFLCPMLAFGAPDPVSHITVKGNRFVTEDGKPIVFRGLAASDPDKLARGQHWNKQYLEAARSWGANIVRFPVHPGAWRSRGRDEYLKLLDQGVGWAKELGLYVIIDWHSIGNLAQEKYHKRDAYYTTRLETMEFWSTLARHYSGDNTVAFFELFNEPAVGDKLGDCSWQEWKKIMEELVAVIRSKGGTAVPLIAGFNFAYDLTPVATAPINAEGIGYVCHPYPMKRKAPWPDKWTRDWGFVADAYPVFITEVGFSAADDKQAHIPVIGDETYGEVLTSYLEKRGISYTAWCFDPDWAPALIKDWNFTPTRQGIYFKAALQQKKPKLSQATSAE
jgi:endoglucanase